MAIDIYEYSESGMNHGTGKRLYFIDACQYKNLQTVLEIYKRKTGLSFGQYDDFILRSGCQNPLIESINEAMSNEISSSIISDLQNFKNLIQKSINNNYGLLFVGD
jgi:hypothetical protein